MSHTQENSQTLEPTWCKHYSSPFHNNECKAGINFDSMRGIDFNKRPCFWKNKDRCESCHKQEWPTQEELEATEKMWADAMDRITKVEPLIKKIKAENKGKDWSGIEPCPVCEGKLSIRLAGCNGHCSVQCSSDGCVSFRE